MQKSTLMNGLMYGGVSILVFLIFYFVKPELNFHMGVGFISSLIIPIYFIRKGIIEVREENEGNISFGEALAVGFPIYFIGALLFNVVQIAVLNVDQEYKAQGEAISVATAKNAMTKTFDLLNVPAEEQAKAMAEIDNNPPEITNTQMMLGFLMSLIFPGLIICLITSAVLKRT